MAQITSASIASLGGKEVQDTQSGGLRVELAVQYDGTGPTVSLPIEVANTPTALADLTARVKAINAAAADKSTAKTALAAGTALDLSAKSTPGPTAAQQWLIDAARLRHLRQLQADGITKAGTDADALASTLNGSYSAAFVA